MRRSSSATTLSTFCVGGGDGRQQRLGDLRERVAGVLHRALRSSPARAHAVAGGASSARRGACGVTVGGACDGRRRRRERRPCGATVRAERDRGLRGGARRAALRGAARARAGARGRRARRRGQHERLAASARWTPSPRRRGRARVWRADSATGSDQPPKAKTALTASSDSAAAATSETLAPIDAKSARVPDIPRALSAARGAYLKTPRGFCEALDSRLAIAPDARRRGATCRR